MGIICNQYIMQQRIHLVEGDDILFSIPECFYVDSHVMTAAYISAVTAKHWPICDEAG